MRDCFNSIDSESVSRGDILDGYKSTMVGSGSEEGSEDGADLGKSGTVVNMKDETSEQQEHEETELVKGKVLTGRRGGKAVKMASCSLCLLVLRKDGLARHLAMHRRKELNTDREEMSNVGKKRKVDKTDESESVGEVVSADDSHNEGVVTTENCSSSRA